jgi:hypothetical protein
MISLTQLIFFFLILFLLFGDSRKYISIIKDFLNKVSKTSSTKDKDTKEEDNKKS